MNSKHMKREKYLEKMGRCKESQRWLLLALLGKVVVNVTRGVILRGRKVHEWYAFV